MRLYIHIPFCQRKCGYCAFASVAGATALHRPYCAALLQELRSLPGRKLASLFFGGGTPTALPVGLLEQILDQLNNHCGFLDSAEVSMEANPGTVTLDSLSRLRRAGVNRLSFGVQSFADTELQQLGRIHTAAQAEEAVKRARQAGFDNLSLDLMYALPGQSPEAWQRSLHKALSLQPQHLSLYQLTPEEGTPLAAALERGDYTLPDEEAVAEMDSCTAALTTAAGLEHYEISNYALPGFRCAHNLAYWHNEEWQAAGAAAVSYVDGCRARRCDSPREYIERMRSGDVVVERETLERGAAFRESVIMGLRLIEGIEVARLESRFGITPREHYGDNLARLVRQGLVEETATHLRLSETGLPLANPIMAELV